MKKINPKDLEVNPTNDEFKRPIGNNRFDTEECGTTVCSEDNYGCTTPTLAIDCTVDTGQSICKCPTFKNCVNTINGCADTVSRGELCCPATNDHNCNFSIRCNSIEYCQISKDIECTKNLNDTNCEAEVMTYIDQNCDTI